MIKTFKLGDTTIQYAIVNNQSRVDLYSIRTPAKKRGTGSARKALAAFLAVTDELSLPVKLLASPLDKKTRLDRLVAFYKSFGFEPTGYRGNAAGDPEMFRGVT